MSAGSNSTNCRIVADGGVKQTSERSIDMKNKNNLRFIQTKLHDVSNTLLWVAAAATLNIVFWYTLISKLGYQG